ncbi:MAG: holo-ACP synthase [Pauljensenia sp.]
MILGIGVDLVALPALAEQVGLPGSTFLTSVLTARERRVVESRARTKGVAPGGPTALAPHVGARWAAKEAFVKAWSAALEGTPPPIPPEDLVWSEIEVVQDHWGRPALVLHGRVAREVARTLGDGDRGAGIPRDAAPGTTGPGTTPDLRWHLSLSHDGDFAVAAVVLERASAADTTAVIGTGPGTDGATATAEFLATSMAGKLAGPPPAGSVPLPVSGPHRGAPGVNPADPGPGGSPGERSVAQA